MEQQIATQNAKGGKMRQTMNDLVIAEMFLIQATLESAVVIGDGINELSRNLRNQEDESDAESVQETLQRIKDQALEPYSSRYNYFKSLVRKDNT